MSLSLKSLNCISQDDSELQEIWQSEIRKANFNVKLLHDSINKGREQLKKILNKNIKQ